MRGARSTSAGYNRALKVCLANILPSQACTSMELLSRSNRLSSAITSLRSSTSCGPLAGLPLQSSAENSTLSDVAMPARHYSSVRQLHCQSLSQQSAFAIVTAFAARPWKM